MNEWKDTTLGKLPTDWDTNFLGELLYIKGRIGWKGLKKSEYLDSGYAIVNGEQIIDGRIDWSKVGRITKDRYIESPEIMLRQDDILMTKDGTIGKIAYIETLPEPATVASGVFVIRERSPKLKQKYLYYFFQSHFFYHLIKSRTEGSVVPHLYQRDFIEMEIPLPNPSEQDRISYLLTCVDKKIDLLRYQNKTLEQIAQTLFKRWFVEFEFPNENGQPYKSSGGEMVASDLGEIPVEWNIKPLDEIADFLNGLAMQKYPPDTPHEYLPVIKIKELKNGFTDATDKANPNIESKYVIDYGNIIFSWSGSLEVVIWNHSKGALNQHLFKVTSKDFSIWYYFSWIKKHMSFFKQIAQSKATTMGHIQRHHLKESLCLIPKKEQIKVMDVICNPLIEKIINNFNEIDNMINIRDSLLPKLMNGQIRITN